MRNALPAAALAALLSVSIASPALASSMLDRPAPPLSVGKWIRGDPPPAWRDLKGRLALLELLDPDDLVSEGLVSRTAEIAAGATERNHVVVYVAVGTRADPGRAAAFADRRKVSWSFGADEGGKTFDAAGGPPLPRYFLVMPDGTVLWEGSPGVLDGKTLDGFVERARLWRPADLAKAIRPAAEAFTARKFGEAVKLARAARDRADPAGPEAKDAALIEDAVKTLAETRLKIAAGLAEKRDSIEALELIQAVEKGFKGTDWEAKAREARVAIEQDRRAQAEIQAMLELRKIVDRARTGGKKAWLAAIQEIDVLMEEVAKNLRAGEKALVERARFQRLLDAPKPKDAPR